MGDFVGELGELGDAVEGLDLNNLSKEDYDALEEKFKASGVGKIFGVGGPDGLNVDPTTGKITLGGSELDLSRENLVKVTEDVSKGDFRAAEEKLGFSKKAIEDPKFQKYESENLARQADSEAVQQQADLENNDTKGKNFVKNNPDTVAETPKNGAEVAKTPGAETEANNVVKDAQDPVKKEEEKGSWVKEKLGKLFDKLVDDGWKIGLGIYALEMMHAMISHHQHAMNGCWLVSNDGSGTKCKLQDPMTCSGDDISDCSGSCSLCSGSQTYPTGKGKGGKGMQTLNTFFTAGTAPPATCVKYEPLPKGAKKGTKQKCKQYLPTCNGGDCSPYCDCSKIFCPPGYTLQCVNVSWWGAAADFLGKGFDDIVNATEGAAKSLGKKIWGIAKWILIAFGAIIVCVAIYYVVSYIVEQKKKKTTPSTFGKKRGRRKKRK